MNDDLNHINCSIVQSKIPSSDSMMRFRHDDVFSRRPKKDCFVRCRIRRKKCDEKLHWYTQKSSTKIFKVWCIIDETIFAAAHASILCWRCLSSNRASGSYDVNVIIIVCDCIFTTGMSFFFVSQNMKICYSCEKPKLPTTESSKTIWIGSACDKLEMLSIMLHTIHNISLFHCYCKFWYFSTQLKSDKTSRGVSPNSIEASLMLRGSVYYLAYIREGKSIWNNRSLGRFSMEGVRETSSWIWLYKFCGWFATTTAQQLSTPSIVCIVGGVKINNIVV